MEKNEIWKEVYRLAAELYKLKPWEYFTEADVFGVEMPDTGTQYFISVMGSAGILSGITAYEGSYALAQYWEMENAENPDASDLLSIPHLILTYEDEKDIDAGQLKQFRSLSNDPVFGFQFPEIRHSIPGRYPLEPDEERLTQMILILEQVIDVATRSKDNADLVFPEEYDEDIYLVRKEDKGKGWMDHYIKVDFPAERYNFTWSRDDIDEIISLPAGNAAMQAHSQLLPIQVIEKETVYFTYMAILVNKKSGRIENYETLIADPDFHSMLEKVPAIFLRFIKSIGFRPRVIEVKSDLHFEMLSEPMRLCGIKLNKYKELPAVSEAINGVLEYSRKNQ